MPGGFGDRGVEGKIAAAHYARESKKPYLGICLGLQVAVIDAARTLLGFTDANSTEFQPASPHPAVVFMPEGSKTHKGGTMRLGVRRTVLQTVDCIAAKLYQREQHIDERHRHRYEVNPEMVPELEAAGCRFVGRDETGQRMEIMEFAVRPFPVVSTPVFPGGGRQHIRLSLTKVYCGTNEQAWALFVIMSSCHPLLRTGPPVLLCYPVPPRVQVPPWQAVAAIPGCARAGRSRLPTAVPNNCHSALSRCPLPILRAFFRLIQCIQFCCLLCRFFSQGSSWQQRGS